MQKGLNDQRKEDKMELFEHYRSVVFFDTETTGLHPEEGDQIIELAMLAQKDGEMAEYDEFIKLPDGERIPDEIVELTGITDEMLASGVEESEAAKAVMDILKEGPVLMTAHNTQFDLGFVREMLRRQFGKEAADEAISSADWLDALTVLKDRKSYPHKLENAVKWYHLEGRVANTHRAIDDAKALAAVCEAMEKQRDDILRYVNIFGFNPKYGVSGEKLGKITYLPQPYTKGMLDPDKILPAKAADKGESKEEKEEEMISARARCRFKKINYGKELNMSQLEAVEATDGPVLVLAGAGSGKTRTLIYRVCHLIENGVNPESILLLTFTNKAAREMQERAAQMLGKAAEQITACTYHSFCTKMLRKYCYAAGLLRDFTVLSGDDPSTIVHMMSAELGYEEVPFFPRAGQIARFISDSVNRRLPLEAVIRKNKKVMEAGGFFKEISAVRDRSEKYKRENDLLDYDDLMTRFLELLENRPDVAEEIDNRYRYICIDEYQDTNPLQADIIKRIRQRNKNLMVVGDDFQGIYGFRGSDVRIIQSFPDEYPGAKVIFLKQNYRSTPEIVGFANKVMDENAVNVRFKKDLVSENPGGNQPIVVKTRSQETEARIIANNIVAAHEHGRPYGNILVLVRNSASFAPMELELSRRKIPYEKRGGLKYLDQPFARDVLAFVRAFVNPKDELSWFRIVQIIKGVGEAQARNIAARLRANGVGDLVGDAYAGKPFEAGLKDLCEFVESLNSAGNVHELVSQIVAFYSEKRIEAVNLKGTDPVKKAEELDKVNREVAALHVLSDLAGTYQTPTELLDSLTLDVPSGDGCKDDGDKVVLSTVHSAKGLEFDTTYVLDCVDGIFPSTDLRSIGTQEDQEELRCFYVAATRAKRLLYLFVPQFCKTNRGNMKKYPSHFLDKAGGVLQEIRK